MFTHLIQFFRVTILLLAAAPAGAMPLLCEAEGATPLGPTAVSLDGTFSTPQGQRFRLAGLLWPDTLEPGRRAALKVTLERALHGANLTYKSAAPPDRWGIQPIHLFVAETGSTHAPFWLQSGLVEAGLVPAWPELPDLCWAQLMPFEQEARRAHRGFWAPRAQAARHRALAANPGAHRGRRMVARWKIHSVRKSQILTYVNIVPFFRVGPSLGLTSKQVQQLAKQGQDPAQMAGRFVVVRFVAGAHALSRARIAQGPSLMLDGE